MANSKPVIDPDALRALLREKFTYDPMSGHLYWREPAGGQTASVSNVIQLKDAV